MGGEGGAGDAARGGIGARSDAGDIAYSSVITDIITVFQAPRGERSHAVGAHVAEGNGLKCQPRWSMTSSVTGARPEKPNARAAAGVTSMTRPRTNGPRSLIRTTTERPLRR